MASVFLSYVRSDLARAQSIALALEKAGHSVWWDRHLTGGSQYSKEIERALKGADVVVVLWSEQSVDSAWVRDEAAAGRDSGHLVPVTLDGAEPPLGFRQYHTIDMSAAAGRGRRAQLQTLLQAVRAVTGVPAAIPTGRHERQRPILDLRLVVAVAVALLGAAALFLVWRNLGPRSAVPVVAVAGADTSPSARAMAHDLLVKLGNLQSARPNLVELTEQPGADADLAFAVGGSRDAQSARASLVLSDGRTRALLWSKDFELPISQQADLQHQIAFTAGRALECAVHALAGEQTGLKRPLVKLYLNGCAAIGEVTPRDLIPTFRQVTAQAPRFEDGWAKLLLVEVLAAINTPGGDPALLRLLNQHIEQARKVNPDLAEAYLAEVLLLEPTDYAGRLRLIDLAIERNPNQPELFNSRAYHLRAVGRMNEAAESTRRASELDPLFALTRAHYISNLNLAGQFERARHELEVAERLWPGSIVMRDARFNIQFVYGDPKDALRLWRSGASSPTPELTESFLRARIDPTPANIDAAVQQARSLFARDPARLSSLARTLGAFDREEELFPILLGQRREALFNVKWQLFNPSLRELRHDRRFMLVAKRLGLITYWQKSGKWPDFCFDADLPYDCKAEAAKLT